MLNFTHDFDQTFVRQIINMSFGVVCAVRSKHRKGKLLWSFVLFIITNILSHSDWLKTFEVFYLKTRRIKYLWSTMTNFVDCFVKRNIFLGSEEFARIRVGTWGKYDTIKQSLIKLYHYNGNESDHIFSRHQKALLKQRKFIALSCGLSWGCTTAFGCTEGTSKM